MSGEVDRGEMTALHPASDKMTEKVNSRHEEAAGHPNASEENFKDMERTATVDIDNYHGIHPKTVLVYLAVCLQYFVQLFNVVNSGAWSRNIAASIGGSDKIVWMSQAIVITTVVLGPPASQAADYWGRKPFLLVAPIFGLIGAVVVARATSMGMAIAGQAVGSVLYISQPILTAVASEILPRRFRPAAQAGLNGAGALGAITGLLAGAAFLEKSSEGWRNIWYMVVGLLGASFLAVALCYRPPARELQISLTTREKLARLDWTAYILLAAGLVLFCMGLSWGNNPYPWSNAHVIAPLVIGAVLFLGLIIHQTFFKKDGLLHHDLFKKDRNLALALGCFLADGVIFWAANNYFSLQVAILYETDGVQVSLHYAIAFFGAVAASILVVVISTFTKSIREPIVISFIFYVVFFALMATTTLTSGNAAWGYPVLLGFGLGWSLTYLVAAAQLSAPPRLIAITSGIMLAARSLGGSIGLAIYHLGADIAEAVLPLGLPPQSLGAFITALADNDEAALFKISGVTPRIIGAGVTALKGAYLISLRRVWIAAAVISAATVLASCFFRNPKRDLNNHVDAPLEGETR